MGPDPFLAQRRADDFRRALGRFAAGLTRHPELDALLERADVNGWHAARIGQVLAAGLPEDAGPGLVLVRLRHLGDSPEPPPVTEHQRRAAASARHFTQPRPPCGRCDGSPARWLDVTPPDHPGAPRVIHCHCWTPPPGYVRPAERHRHNRAGWATY